MSKTNASPNWRGYGTIDPEGEILLWKPAADVARHAGDDFRLRHQERRSSEMRLILPEGGFVIQSQTNRLGPGVFFYDVQRGGLAILIARGLNAESRQRHDTAFLYVQKLIGSKTWLRRRFTGPIDFKISHLVQNKLGVAAVVPAAFDMATAISGDVNTEERAIKSLLKLGNEEAERRAIAKPNRVQVIHLGFYAAAKLDPLPPESLTPKEIRRSALLDAEMAPRDVTDDELQMVAERFADAVELCQCQHDPP